MFITLWTVRCDVSDALGRTRVRISKHGMQPTELFSRR